MEMDMDETSTGKECASKGNEEQANPIVVILVGAPGSGKSTFCDNVMRSSSRPWVRICQDTIGNGKAGTKAQCLKSAANALKDGKSVFIDRCNLDREQRSDFVKLGGSQVDVHAVVLDLPAKLCISRSVKRTGHEGNLQGGMAAAVVNRMLQKKELPELNEGLARITYCHNDTDVQSAFDTYTALGPQDTLPRGCIGRKIPPDSKRQLSIMKFLMKADHPANTASNVDILKDSATRQTAEKNVEKSETASSVPLTNKAVQKGEGLVLDSLGGDVSLNDTPILAFPSISTADFQFNLEKASEVIVEEVEKFVSKLGNARLVLVDLSHGSNILSLVKAKAAQRNIDSNRFSTFIGDITRLCSEGGLRCNVIANAANWRLKPGGGGVNAAIYSAAGPSLEGATKEQANFLLPGNVVVVPLPSTSPLFSREGVTHIIHVLGPNMNPQRPDCLNNDYSKGCQLLRSAYSSLFNGFASIVEGRSKESSENLASKPVTQSPKHSQEGPTYPVTSSNHKFNRDVQDSGRSKKCKVSQDKPSSDSTAEMVDTEKIVKIKIRTWAPWFHALYDIAMHPEKHKDTVLEISNDVVVLNDLYPKAQKHLLVLARCEDLECLADVGKEHLQLLRTMHEVGLKWARKFLEEDKSLIFRLGYHSEPSMKQLHLHVISQDFDSKHLKNKKHWNSFNTAFFRDSVNVIEEVNSSGIAIINHDKNTKDMELRCNRCRSAHPTIPLLKSHVTKCRAPFPSTLLQNNRLVQAPP